MHDVIIHGIVSVHVSIHEVACCQFGAGGKGARERERERERIRGREHEQKEETALVGVLRPSPMAGRVYPISATLVVF